MKSSNLSKEKLKEMYKKRKVEIKNRLEEFKNVLKAGDDKIFAEIAFCICTPQSKATKCWEAIKTLKENGLLFSGDENQIRVYLKGVRFAHKKSKYIVEARKFFTKDGKLSVKQTIAKFSGQKELRNWLAENIKGFGLKEASHFIRNIGLSNNRLAILDRHILSNLKVLGVINSIPKSLSKKTYELIETKMKKFSKEVKIPLDALDLLLWSEKTGFILK